MYIGSGGYLQLNFNWKVIIVFVLELIVSFILGMAYNQKKDKTAGKHVKEALQRIDMGISVTVLSIIS